MTSYRRRFPFVRSRLFLLVTAVAVAGLTAAGTQLLSGSPVSSKGPAAARLVSSFTTRAASTASGSTPSGVTGGALFGANYPLVSAQSSLGRKLAIVRLYYHIGDTFPGNAKYRALLAKGQTVLVSLDSNGASYASIAAGQQDGPITTFLKALNQDAVKYNLGAVYVSFEHEPDNVRHKSLGTPAQFRAAWDHVHELAASASLDWNNGGMLHWVLILIHNTYLTPAKWWPGAREVDIVAADGYNSAGCGRVHQHDKPWTPAKVFGPLVSFAASHGGIPVFLAEWGSDNVPAGEQATFIGQMQTYVATHSLIAGALYWNTFAGNCDYKIDGNAGSISAMKAMGNSTALQGHTIGGGG